MTLWNFYFTLYSFPISQKNHDDLSNELSPNRSEIYLNRWHRCCTGLPISFAFIIERGVILLELISPLQIYFTRLLGSKTSYDGCQYTVNNCVVSIMQCNRGMANFHGKYFIWTCIGLNGITYNHVRPIFTNKRMTFVFTFIGIICSISQVHW